MSAFTSADDNVLGAAGHASALYQEKKPCALAEHLEDADMLKVKRQFVRTYSGASTEDFETPAADGHGGFNRCFSDGDYSLSPTSRCQSEHMDWMDEVTRVKSNQDRMEAIGESVEEAKILFKKKFGHEVDEASEPGDFARDEDGTIWIRTAGEGVERQREVYNQRLDALFDSLQETKDLFRSQCGDEIIASDDSDDDDVGLDEDGTAWTRTTGQGAAEQRSTYRGKVAAVQDLCEEVKALWKAKFGEDYDSDSDASELVDDDNTAWVKTAAESADIQKWAYRERLDALDQSLAEAKQAYMDRVGDRVEDCDPEDYVHDADGTPWARTEGGGVEAQRESYFDRLGGLEASLAEVKVLFHDVTGQDPEEEDFVDDDGTLWVRTEGDGAESEQDAYDERICRLTSLLDEAKDLYAAQTGEDPDEPDFVDEDGMLWTRVEAVPVDRERVLYNRRVEELLANCTQAKALFEASSGETVDEEDFVDEDGTLWIREVGAGFPKQCEAYQRQVDELELSLRDLQSSC